MRKLCASGLMLSPFMLILFAANLDAQNFVYVNRNRRGANSVTAFSVASNGALTPVAGSPFVTGGLGTGAAGLYATNRARVCVVANRLYVANDLSHDVSGFDINPVTGALTLVPSSPFATSGQISLDCTPNGQFLIAAGSDKIAVFSIAANGSLTQIPGSPFAVFGQPDGVKVTPNGQFLFVALNLLDAVGIFSIASNGELTAVPGSPFASPAAGAVAGVEINCASNFLFAAQAQFGGTNVDVFSIASNGALTLIQTSNNPGVGDNSNVAVLSPNQQFLFVSNQSSNTITVFNVASKGTLSLVGGSPFANPGGHTPQQLATNQGGAFLYANNDDGTVSVFSVASNGALSPVAGSPFAAGSSLRPGIAAFPQASACPTNITAVATASCPLSTGAVVTFVPASDSGCGTVSCSPASGSFFPVGTTTVNCTTTAGSSCSFTVTVSSFCLQDETNPGNLVLVNSTTGDYSFFCNGVLIASGTGTLNVKGCEGTIEHNKGDRRVLIKWDTTAEGGTGAGTAIVQFGVNNTRCQITDKNMSNNTCAAPPSLMVPSDGKPNKEQNPNWP